MRMGGSHVTPTRIYDWPVRLSC